MLSWAGTLTIAIRHSGMMNLKSVQATSVALIAQSKPSEYSSLLCAESLQFNDAIFISHGGCALSELYIVYMMMAEEPKGGMHAGW